MEQKNSILNPDFWEYQWEKAKRSSTVKINDKNYKKWLNFWDFVSEIYDDIEKSSVDLVNKAIKIMKDEELISKNSKVFEIGCGTGTFTIPLSFEVKHITALDSSKGMLDKLRTKLESLKISNIELIHERWEDKIINEKYDFVFAAFCPAINDKKRLIKMKELSDGYACLISFSKLDNLFAIRNEIWKILTGHEFISKSFHILYPFGILYALGYRPQLRKIVTKQIIERDVKKLIMQYEHYFKIFISLSNKHKKAIRKFFEEKAVDRKIILENAREIYFMWW